VIVDQQTVETFLADFAAEVAKRTAEILAETQPRPDRLLAPAEAADRLGVTERTVRKLTASLKGEEPQLPSVLVADGARRISNADIDEYIAKRRGTYTASRQVAPASGDGGGSPA
jgi:excisionase family DNA binding protein